jgi:MinD-like ATPase involved in chromosome partitioning or flagellar assembly
MSESIRSPRFLVLTLVSPSGRHNVEVPADARVDDLLPSLVEVCEGGSDPAGWTLVPMGEAPVAPERTLAECRIFSGALMELVPPARPNDTEALPDAFSAAELVRRVKARLQPPARMPDTQRMGDSAYRRLLEDAIVAPRRGGSTVVAVTSAHAGAGTTTVAVLLATLLSSIRNDQMAIVDACLQSGALSHWMAPESGSSGEAYRALLEPASTPERIQAALVPIGRGLAILPAPSEQLGKPAAEELGWGRLIQHLHHLHHVVILDCGADLRGPAGRAALTAADQVVLVSKSSPDDLNRLGRTIDTFRGKGRAVVVVANQATRRARTRPSALGVQLVTLAYEPEAAQRLKTRGFSWSDAPETWQESIRELAATLIASGQLAS